MPARSDIDPAEIPILLPHVIIVDKLFGELRYRIMGSGVAQQLGRDLTGRAVGSYLSEPQAVAKARAIYERVFSLGEPVFGTAQYRTIWGNAHDVSQLILPLSENGVDVNMALCSRVARFSSCAAARDWLKGAPLAICSTITVANKECLRERCLDWEASLEGVRPRQGRGGSENLSKGLNRAPLGYCPGD